MMDAQKDFPRWRILIVDDERSTRLEHYQNLRDEQDGRYEFFFAGEEGQQGEALLDDAENRAKEHRCHLALVDMRLLDGTDRTDYSGLDLVPKLKPTESIVVTGYANKARIAEIALAKGARHIVDKGDPAELREVVKRTLKECGYRDVEITWPPELNETHVANHLFPNNPDLFEDEARDVLRRLFKSASFLRVILLDSENNTPSLTLRPRSLVIQLKQDDHPRSHFVKIGRRMKAEQEVKNFKDVYPFFSANPYIEPTSAPFTFWNIGGAVYDFSGDYVQLRPKLFSKYYGSKGARDIRKALENLHELWKPLYRDRKKTGEIRLLRAYREVWGTDWLDDLRSYANTHSPTVMPFEVLALPGLPDPIAWLIGKVFEHDGRYKDSKTPFTQVAKTHGDLHGDNFFVTKDHVVWPIDFERTGDGPILQDWIELEHDILTRLLPLQPTEGSLFARLICIIAKPSEIHGWNRVGGCLLDRINHPQVDKTLEVIDKIRDLAKQSEGSPTVDAQPYVWGLLLNSVFRLMIWSKEDEEYKKPLSQEDAKKFKVRKEKLQLGIQRCLVLAGILCHRLENWEEEEDDWPPKEWETLLADSHSSVGPETSPIPESNNSRYALIIGVGETPYDPALSLTVAVNDAEVLRETLAYPLHNVRVLSNATASLEQIKDGLKWLADQTAADPDSTAIVYFSGHGGHLQTDHRYFLVPSNIEPGNIEDTVLWASEFTQRLRAIQAKRMLVLIDACHAGSMAAAKDTSELHASGFIEAPPPENLLESWQQIQLTGSVKQATSAQMQGEGRAVISSSRGDQSSYVRKDGTLSIFTYHLQEAIRGENSRPGDTFVTVSTLIGHLSKAVPDSAQRDWSKPQVPWTDFTGEDFIIAALGEVPGGISASPKPAPDPNRPITVFFSYSHKDEKLRDRLENHLSILKREGVIANWHDRRISAGREWEGAIDDHLRSAGIVLLLISADFLASDYCYDVEMKLALERHNAGEARVIPVILRPVDWKGAPFGKLLALPTDGRPVMEWKPSDKGFQDVARGIRMAVDELRASQP